MTDVLGRIRALGSAFSLEQIQGSAAIFAPLLPACDETIVERDVAYGPDPRHRLDLFGARKPGIARPIVAFVHGGGFIGGDKGAAGAPFYNNVGAWAARHGWIGCTITYRLAPAHPWPAGRDDVASAIGWLRAHAADIGGDADRIVLIGQSAGAAHVAAFAATDAATGALAGAAMLSGIYDVANADRNPYQSAYYGDDPTQFAAQSSIEGLAATPLPCLYTVAEFDPPDFQRQAAAMISRRVAATGAWPEFHRLAGQNHITPVQQIGSSADAVGPILAGFIDQVTRQSIV
ncbi:alpha/beta hydrolase [Blastomonas fulva]|uniref:alpha/beta hydrolase n=1 Tax=Blastomonas fulva TaxID=1550728 RepID=UPI0025A4182B|nr:alpha/beta hydrolase [Blastomonas fulva]MDM7928757.1 alpha/beta hydrolase [Blastomonas fulva]MDM7964543.1 alpha/beta hydrolase [Blastomonas fulva]